MNEGLSSLKKVIIQNNFALICTDPSSLKDANQVEKNLMRHDFKEWRLPSCGHSHIVALRLKQCIAICVLTWHPGWMD